METGNPARVDLFVDLDEGRDEPLYRQIYEGVREAVLSGRLSPGTRIPSTRDLADHLDVSRTTVLTATNRLAAEGFLETKVGVGTRISPEIRPRGPAPESRRGTDSSTETGPRLSDRGRRLAGLPSPASAREAPIPFEAGVPALDRFPLGAWSRTIGRAWREAEGRALSHGDPAGEAVLREAVAGHLRAARGLSCGGEQVLITAGTQQGLDLAARLLLDPGDRAWMEDPGYDGARSALLSAEADMVPVPVDGDGLRVEKGRERAPDARLACVTPSHHFPLGVPLSLPRRLELLEWAEKAEGWVLEDDYDSEFRFEGRPLLPLRGVDRGDRVLYFGSFSKTLFPSLRLGYVVLPEALIEPFRRYRATLDRHPPTVPQLALAEFISSGRFARHLRRMRSVYRKRNEALRNALGDALGERCRVSGSATGLHLVVRLPEELGDEAICRRAADRGLAVSPLSGCYANGDRARPGLVLGFGAYDRKAIEEGVEELAELLPG